MRLWTRPNKAMIMAEFPSTLRSDMEYANRELGCDYRELKI